MDTQAYQQLWALEVPDGHADIFETLQRPLLVDELGVMWLDVLIHGAEDQSADEQEEQHVRDTGDDWIRSLRDATCAGRKSRG